MKKLNLKSSKHFYGWIPIHDHLLT